MVNNRNGVCSFYPLSKIQELVRADRFQTVNRRASNKLEDLQWDNSMLQAFILALADRHFRKRYPAMTHSGEGVIDCDGYEMSFNEETKKADDVDGDVTLFIKLAISSEDETLIVSFHP